MASSSGTQDIARRYASALFEIARDKGALDQVLADLRALAAAARDSSDFAAVLSSPALTRDAQSAAVRAVAEAAKASPLTLNFLGVLALNRRLAALPAAAAAFEAAVAAHKGEITAEVTAAEPLTPAQIEAVSAGLKQALGKTVRVRALHDAALMGGLVVRVGSKLIDASVRAKLDRLSRALASSDKSADNARMKEVA